MKLGASQSLVQSDSRHGDRLLAGPWTWGLWVAPSRKGRWEGAVAGSRRLWWNGAGGCVLLRFVLFFVVVVVDVPVVHVVDVGFSS